MGVLGVRGVHGVQGVRGDQGAETTSGPDHFWAVSGLCKSGAPKGGAPKGGRPKISRFSPLPPQFSVFLLSLGSFR